MRLSDLQEKKIININTGKNIGTIIDIDINDNGSINYLIIEEGRSLFNINKESDIKVSWEDITKVGEDVILVKKD
ncbi:MAG: YlmC/YmxH family sporulation protein [Bacilli bacterium]|nr:YlmC/YmxH family sporulation protein [Bacilli bacterium]